MVNMLLKQQETTINMEPVGATPIVPCILLAYQ